MGTLTSINLKICLISSAEMAQLIARLTSTLRIRVRIPISLDPISLSISLALSNLDLVGEVAFLSLFWLLPCHLLILGLPGLPTAH